MSEHEHAEVTQEHIDLVRKIRLTSLDYQAGKLLADWSAERERPLRDSLRWALGKVKNLGTLEFSCSYCVGKFEPPIFHHDKDCPWAVAQRALAMPAESKDPR